jgi:hypothetical protein
MPGVRRRGTTAVANSQHVLEVAPSGSSVAKDSDPIAKVGNTR